MLGNISSPSYRSAGDSHSHQHLYRLVFLGLALDKQNKDDEAAKAYTEATKIKQDDALAWQGLVNLCEGQNGKMLDDYHTAAVHLAEIFMKAYVFRTSSISIKTNHGNTIGMTGFDARRL